MECHSREVLCAALVGGCIGLGVGLLAQRYFPCRESKLQSSLASGTKTIYLVGVDLGGTSAKVGILKQDGTVLFEQVALLSDGKSLNSVCDTIASTVKAGLSQLRLSVPDVSGFGVCVPGLVDTEQGTVKFAATFPDWPRPACFAGELERRIGIRPKIENDANVALLAELWRGAAKGANNAVMLTLGTGVGSAIVCDGNLLRGATGFAGEVGHAILERGGRLSKGTGVHGVVEEYVSARAVGERAIDALKDPSMADIPSEMRSLSPTSCIDAKVVFDLAKKKDVLALKIVDETVEALAVVCINLVRILDTDNIIFGGGLVAAGEILIQGIREKFESLYWNLNEPTCQIKVAELGPRAGMIGAASLGL